MMEARCFHSMVEPASFKIRAYAISLARSALLQSCLHVIKSCPRQSFRNRVKRHGALLCHSLQYVVESHDAQRCHLTNVPTKNISVLYINASTLATSAIATAGLLVYKQTSFATRKPSIKCARINAVRWKIAAGLSDGGIISCDTCKGCMALRIATQHRLWTQQATVCRLRRSMRYIASRCDTVTTIIPCAADRLLYWHPSKT